VRRRRPRLSPAAVAIPLLVVATTGTTTAIRRLDDRHGPHGGPATFAVLSGGHVALLQAADPTLPPVGLGPDVFNDVTATAVAAVGDRHVYYTAGSRGDACTAMLERVEIDGSGTQFETVVQRVAGRVTELAVSPDGRWLAYVALVSFQGYCHWPVLHVRDLRTGAERVWRHADDGTGDAPYVESLSWAPDGRRLALTATPCCRDDTLTGVRVLDTSGRPGDYLDVPVLAADVSESEREGCSLHRPAFRGGDLVVVRACRAFPLADNAPVVRLVSLDQATGRVGPPLFTLRGGVPDTLTFDRTGRHALVVTGRRGAPSRLTRWDGGRSDTVVDVAGLPVAAACW
jgi:hypothetical protein